MGFAVVMASALTGLAVLRMYFSLFCGRSDVAGASGLRLGLRRREAWTFVALVIALIGFGLVPRPLVDSRFDASEEILRLREMRYGTKIGEQSSGESPPAIQESLLNGVLVFLRAALDCFQTPFQRTRRSRSSAAAENENVVLRFGRRLRAAEHGQPHEHRHDPIDPFAMLADHFRLYRS